MFPLVIIGEILVIGSEFDIWRLNWMNGPNKQQPSSFTWRTLALLFYI